MRFSRFILAGAAVLGTAGLMALAGCSNVTQSDKCFLAEAAVCAQTADPITNRPGNGACLNAALQACGVIPSVLPTPSPSPSPAGH